LIIQVFSTSVLTIDRSWREAVIRDTWMSAKCHSRQFYDVLSLPLSPDTDVSQNDQQFRRVAETSGARKPRKRDGGIVANKFSKKSPAMPGFPFAGV
jgi:hypothetical protein